MEQVIQVILGVVLFIVAIKVLFFMLAFLGLALGLVGLVVKLAIVGGLLYLAFLFLRALFNKREASF